MKGRIASQSRTISACIVMTAVLTVYVLAFPDEIHPSARLIFAYSFACAVLIIPLNLVCARALCRFVVRSQQILRRHEQFGRPVDKTDLSVSEMLASIVQVNAARGVRTILLLVTGCLSYRLGWGFDFFPQRFPLAIIWAVTVFVALGGVAGRPLRPRSRSAFIGFLVLVLGSLAPVPLVLFMATTAAIGGAALAIGLGIFQHPLMYSREVTGPIMSGAFRKSVNKYMRSE